MWKAYALDLGLQESDFRRAFTTRNILGVVDSFI